jgi:hypothetical protein
MALLATRRHRHSRLPDAALLDAAQYLEALGAREDLEPLGDNPTVRCEVPNSGPVVRTSIGIPLDEVEDLLPESAAYRQDGFGVEELHGQSRDHSDASRTRRGHRKIVAEMRAHCAREASVALAHRVAVSTNNYRSPG